MEVWELIARESIRDLVARYNASGDAGRFDETLALFSEEATLEVVPQRIYRGRDEIRSLFTAAASAPVRSGGATSPHLLRHFTASHQIDIVGPADARGRCYFAVLTAVGLDHWGRYVDEYCRPDDRWLFRSRRVTIDASVEGSWAEGATSRLAERPA